jgi:hypothetical protein
MGCGTSAAGNSGVKQHQLLSLELTDFGEDLAEPDMMLPNEDGGGPCTSIELQLLREHGAEMIRQRRTASKFLASMRKEHVSEALVFASWEMWNAKRTGGHIVYAPPVVEAEAPGMNAQTFAEIVGGLTHTGFWMRKLFECCDVDSDGNLPLLEFLRFLPKIVNVPKSDSAALVFFFNLLDSDKSGFITEMDLASLHSESKSTAHRDSRDNFGLAGVQTDKAHRRRAEGPVTLLEYIRALPDRRISFPQVVYGVLVQPLVFCYTLPLRLRVERGSIVIVV